MVELCIRQATVQQLHNMVQRNQQQHDDDWKPGILLRPDGWHAAEWPQGGEPGYPIAFTGDQLPLVKGRLDVDAAQILALHRFAVPSEIGDDTFPSADTEAVVVTGVHKPDLVDPYSADWGGSGWEYEHSWQHAWWFDRRTARQVVAPVPTGLKTTESLWVTASDRYALCQTSTQEDTVPELWSELTYTEAARFVWGVDPAPEFFPVLENPPALIMAARLMRQLTDFLTFDPFDDPHAARVASDTAKAISDLTRADASSEFRTQRRIAIRWLHEHHGHDLSQTASTLGLSRKTVSDLLNSNDVT